MRPKTLHEMVEERRRLYSDHSRHAGRGSNDFLSCCTQPNHKHAEELLLFNGDYVSVDALRVLAGRGSDPATAREAMGPPSVRSGEGSERWEAPRPAKEEWASSTANTALARSMQILSVPDHERPIYKSKLFADCLADDLRPTRKSAEEAAAEQLAAEEAAAANYDLTLRQVGAHQPMMYSGGRIASLPPTPRHVTDALKDLREKPGRSCQGVGVRAHRACELSGMAALCGADWSPQSTPREPRISPRTRISLELTPRHVITRISQES